VGGTTGGGRGGPTVAVAVAAVLWGTIGVAQAWVPAPVPAIAVGAAGMGVGGLLLGLGTLPWALRVLRDAAAARWLVLGAIGVVVYPLTVYPAMRLAGVAVANVVALGSGPGFTALLEWAIERRRPGLVWLAATCCAVLGIALLGLGGPGGAGADAPGGDAVSGGAPQGILLALTGGLAYASYAIASKRAIARGHGSTPVMGVMFGLAGLVLVPIALGTGAALFADPLSSALVGYLAIGPLAIAYLLFGFGVRALPASSAATIALLEPAVATLLAVLVLGEGIAAIGWAGFALVIASVLLVAALDGRRPSSPSIYV